MRRPGKGIAPTDRPSFNGFLPQAADDVRSLGLEE